MITPLATDYAYQVTNMNIPSGFMNTKNKKEIALFGIKRSGNHAIIHWLLKHMGDKTVHINDVTSINPYDHFCEMNVKGLPTWRIKPNLLHLIKQRLMNYEITEYSKQDKAVDFRYICNFTPKDCLIISYENCSIDDETYAKFIQEHDTYVGVSDNRYRVIVLRDAFNLFSSLHKASFVTEEDIRKCVELYKQYAEIFLSTDLQKKHDVICINFNEWFLSRDYRVQLAKKFGVTIDGSPFQRVPAIGGGSSFEGTSKCGHAQTMNVLERWKVCKDDSAYRAIFKEKYLVELSEAIFGRVAPANFVSCSNNKHLRVK